MTYVDVIDDNASAGDRLRYAREQLSLSIKEVASALHLLVNHVRAIEANRFDALADDDQFVRRLHDYARLVDLDADEIVDVYRTQSAAILEPIQPQPAKNQQRHRGTGYAAGALAVVGVCLGSWWLIQILPSESSNTVTSRNESTEDTPSNAALQVNNDQPALHTPGDNVTTVSVPPSMERRGETMIPGKKTTPTDNETAVRSDQARSTEGPVNPDVTDDIEPVNTHVGTQPHKNTLLTVGDAPLNKTLADLHNHQSAQAPATVSSSSKPTGTSTPLRSTAWFASLAPDRFTVQLVSFTREVSSQAFIRRRHLEAEAAYVAIRNDDQTTWYAVTYGLYDSFEAAEAARQSLPDSLKDLKPRVRNTGRIQQIMRREQRE